MSVLMKYRLPLAGAGLVVLGLVAVLRKESSQTDFDNTDGRKRLSDFEIAEAQSGKGNRLKEHGFADLKAQEAFSSKQTAPTATPPKEEITPSDGSARDRAQALLGSAPTESPKTGAHEPKVSPPASEPPSEAPRPQKQNQASSRPTVRRPEGVSLAAAPAPAREVESRPASHPGTGGGVYAKNPPTVMMQLDNSEVTETLGARSTFVRGDLLKMGSVYLAEIPDAIDVRGSRKQTLNINVVGKMTQHTLNQPFVLVAEASLAEDGRSIFIEVKHCIAPEANARAIACSGDVKGLDGTDGLKNEIYAPQIWPSILSVIGAAGEVYALGRMTQSVTQAGVLMDQTQSNALWSAAGSAWKKSFDLTSERLEKDRQGGRASGKAIVKVLITKDVSLW